MDTKATLPYKEFGDRLTWCREAFCFTQKEIVDACKIPQSTIANAERGKFIPSQDKLERLCKFLKVSPQWLKEGRKHPFEPPLGPRKPNVIVLNKCRKKKSEVAALRLIESYRHCQLMTIYNTEEKCILIKYVSAGTDGFFILYLSDPYNSESAIDKIGALKVGESSEDFLSGVQRLLLELRAVINEDYVPTEFRNEDVVRLKNLFHIDKELLLNAIEHQNIDIFFMSLRKLLQTDPELFPMLKDFFKSYFHESLLERQHNDTDKF